MLEWPNRIRAALLRRIRHAAALYSARTSSRRNISGVTAGNILVLCYGNIYRSPFVERRLAQLLDPGKWKLKSAGFYQKTGRPCAPEYIYLANDFGVSLVDHQSSTVGLDDIEWADLIVIMDRKNWDDLRSMAPGTDNKIVWVACCLEDGLPEVIDPYNLPVDAVGKIIRRLDRSAVAISRQLQST